MPNPILPASISLTASREFSATEFIFMAHMTEPLKATFAIIN